MKISRYIRHLSARVEIVEKFNVFVDTFMQELLFIPSLATILAICESMLSHRKEIWWCHLEQKH